MKSPLEDMALFLKQGMLEWHWKMSLLSRVTGWREGTPGRGRRVGKGEELWEIIEN